jgi:hypothetical protein
VLTRPLPEDLVGRAAEEAQRLFEVMVAHLGRDQRRGEDLA